MHRLAKQKDQIIYFQMRANAECRSLIQLFRERLSEKNVHATIPKGNMGYDQYSVPDTVAVESTFVAFL